MNVFNFLSENFVWILVVLLLTIVTIIGFLVDRKKNAKKKEEQTMPNGNMNMSNSALQSGVLQANSAIQQPQPINFNSQPVNSNGNMINNMLNNPGNINNVQSQPVISVPTNVVQQPQPQQMQPANNPAPSLQNFKPQMFSEPVSQVGESSSAAMQSQNVIQTQNMQPQPMNQSSFQGPESMSQPVNNSNFVNNNSINTFNGPEPMHQNNVNNNVGVSVPQPMSGNMSMNNPEMMYQVNNNIPASAPRVDNNMMNPQMGVVQPMPQNVQPIQGQPQMGMPNNMYNVPVNQPMEQPAFNQNVNFNGMQPVNFVYGNQNSNQN